MHSVIWKYPLEITDTQTVSMPFGAKILCVQTQNNAPCLWALISNADSPNSPEPRRIEVHGTGNPIPEQDGWVRLYIGTVQTHGGMMVWHVFETVQ